MNKRKQTVQEQHDQFDERSLDILEDLDEIDEYEEYIEDYESYEDEESAEEKREIMNTASRSLGLDGKGKFILIAVLIIIILGIIIFNPFKEKDSENTGNNEGFFSSLIGKIFGNEDNDVNFVDPVEGDEIDMLIGDLEFIYDGYLVYDNGEGSISVEGIIDGQEHNLIFDYDGNTIYEELDGEILIDSKSEINNDNKADQQNNIPQNNIPLTDNTENGQTEQSDSVSITREDYEKSILSLPLQNYIKPEEGEDLNIKTTYDKYIVNYEKLPLRGPTAMLFATVIDTGEKIIFQVPLETYLKIEDKGSTVIAVKVVEIDGVKSYDSVTLDNWK